jgi:superfamily II DNA or RNA helicase
VLESAAISKLEFPFPLKEDQIEAVNAWIDNDYRGTILYSTGTGKTEIALECAKRFAFVSASSTYPSFSSLPFLNILLIVPRIILIEQNIKRLVSYGISKEKIGAYFGERKEIREITICTYQSIIRNLNLIRRSYGNF